MTDELWALPATEIGTLVAKGEVSAAAVIQAHLDRIDAVNQTVNAVTQSFADQARQEAQDIDRRRAEGKELGPLAGVPFTVKDNIDVAGYATTHGLTRFAQMVRSADAPPVARLRRAGAIPIGHSNLPTLALRGMHTSSELYGDTINPWDASKTPGGSSGGDAVAVATGMAPVGLGNDSSSSLRNPATFNGVCALKPSYGRYPTDHRMSQDDPTLASQIIPVDGPITRGIADLDLVHRALSGTDPRDPRAVPVPVTGPDLPNPIRVGVVFDPGGYGVDPDVQAGVETAASALTDAGYAVEEVQLPRLTEALDAYGAMIITEFAQGWPMIRTLVGADAARYIEMSMGERPPVELAEYLTLTGLRLNIQRSWAEFMDQHPLVLGAVCTKLAFEPGQESRDVTEFRRYGQSMALSTVTSFVGHPSVAVPVAPIDGFPRGVQLVGRMYREDTCLRAAAVIEQRYPGRTPIDPH